MADDKVQTVVVDLSDLAIELEGEDYYKEPVVYDFGGGKAQFKDKGSESNLYNP